MTILHLAVSLLTAAIGLRVAVLIDPGTYNSSLCLQNPDVSGYWTPWYDVTALTFQKTFGVWWAEFEEILTDDCGFPFATECRHKFTREEDAGSLCERQAVVCPLAAHPRGCPDLEARFYCSLAEGSLPRPIHSWGLSGQRHPGANEPTRDCELYQPSDTDNPTDDSVDARPLPVQEYWRFQLSSAHDSSPHPCALTYKTWTGRVSPDAPSIVLETTPDTCLANSPCCRGGLAVAFWLRVGYLYEYRGTRSCNVLKTPGLAVSLEEPGVLSFRARAAESYWSVTIADLGRHTWSMWLVAVDFVANMTVYKNGQPVASRPSNASAADDQMPTDARVTLFDSSPPITSPFALTDLAVYDVPLSWEQASRLHRSFVEGLEVMYLYRQSSLFDSTLVLECLAKGPSRPSVRWLSSDPAGTSFGPIPVDATHRVYDPPVPARTQTASVLQIVGYNGRDVIVCEAVHPSVNRAVYRYYYPEEVPMSWTEWFSADTPGEDGIEEETFDVIKEMLPRLCWVPAGIRCRAKYTHAAWNETGQVLAEPCTVEGGVRCENEAQTGGLQNRCLDYEVSFFCPNVKVWWTNFTAPTSIEDYGERSPTAQVAQCNEVCASPVMAECLVRTADDQDEAWYSLGATVRLEYPYICSVEGIACSVGVSCPDFRVRYACEIVAPVFHRDLSGAVTVRHPDSPCSAIDEGLVDAPAQVPHACAERGTGASLPAEPRDRFPATAHAPSPRLDNAWSWLVWLRADTEYPATFNAENSNNYPRLYCFCNVEESGLGCGCSIDQQTYVWTELRPSSGQWHFLLVSFSTECVAPDVRVYMDGGYMDISSIGDGFPLHDGVYVGDGYFSQLNIFNRRLLDVEAQTLYACGVLDGHLRILALSLSEKNDTSLEAECTALSSLGVRISWSTYDAALDIKKAVAAHANGTSAAAVETSTRCRRTSKLTISNPGANGKLFVICEATADSETVYESLFVAGDASTTQEAAPTPPPTSAETTPSTTRPTDSPTPGGDSTAPALEGTSPPYSEASSRPYSETSSWPPSEASSRPYSEASSRPYSEMSSSPSDSTPLPPSSTSTVPQTARSSPTPHAGTSIIQMTSTTGVSTSAPRDEVGERTIQLMLDLYSYLVGSESEMDIFSGCLADSVLLAEGVLISAAHALPPSDACVYRKTAAATSYVCHPWSHVGASKEFQFGVTGDGGENKLNFSWPAQEQANGQFEYIVMCAEASARLRRAAESGDVQLTLGNSQTSNGTHISTTRVVKSVLNSDVMTFKARQGGSDVSWQVSFTLRHNEDRESFLADISGATNYSVRIACVFWKPYYRVWSDWGCRPISTQLTSAGLEYTECFCNHSTSFAVLMQVTDYEISELHVEILTWITYIGCSVSLCLVVVAIILFIYLRGLIQSERNFIHKNLMVAYALAQATFLAGIDRTENRIVCKAIAVLLHYLYLSVFGWMLVEGCHLYLKVVRVFGSENINLKLYAGVGWGAPLLLTAVSFGIGFDGYGTGKCCWIDTSSGLPWAFVAPALAVILFNFGVLLLVVRVVVTSAKQQKGNELDQIRAGLKGALVLLPILGLTWFLGVLAVNGATVAFQYAFTVCNSVQGALICLFHCALNSEVRAAWRRKREQRRLIRAVCPVSATDSTTGNNTVALSTNDTGFNATEVTEGKRQRVHALPGLHRAITCTPANETVNTSTV